MNETTSVTHAQSPPGRQRIVSFRRRFGQPHLDLACHAAFPIALTPELLYLVWDIFRRDIDDQPLNIPWVAVADLLLSSLCDETGYELYEMDEGVRAELLQELRTSSRFGPTRIAELSELLRAYVSQQLLSHDTYVRDLAEVQELAALAVVDPTAAAHRLTDTYSQSDLQDRARLIQLGSLVEALAPPLSTREFETLLPYARALTNWARSDQPITSAPDDTEHVAVQQPQPRRDLEESVQSSLSVQGTQLRDRSLDHDDIEEIRQKYNRIAQKALLTISVVVHVVWRIDEENISDAQIRSQLEALNRDFRAKNPDIIKVPAPFKEHIGDARIEFALATTDPHGNRTIGITRTQTSKKSFSSNDEAKSSATGGVDPWDTKRYLNIWVCTLSGGILGYSQYPGGPPATDGVVIFCHSFGTTGIATAPFNMGRTAVSEWSLVVAVNRSNRS